MTSLQGTENACTTAATSRVGKPAGTRTVLYTGRALCLIALTAGFLFYGGTWVAGWVRGRPLPPGLALLVALGVEGTWEIAENTNTVIDRYGATNIALNYYGDSAINSVTDIGAMIAGFWLRGSKGFLGLPCRPPAWLVSRSGSGRIITCVGVQRGDCVFRPTAAPLKLERFFLADPDAIAGRSASIHDEIGVSFACVDNHGGGSRSSDLASRERLHERICVVRLPQALTFRELVDAIVIRRATLIACPQLRDGGNQSCSVLLAQERHHIAGALRLDSLDQKLA